MKHRWLAWVLVVALVVALPATGSAQAARRGAWVDEVVGVEVADPAAAVARLESGDIDVYATGISSPDLARRIQASRALAYATAYGSYRDLGFNPAGPVLKDGSLNPFASRKIREAMNWLVDRDYIAREIYGGLAVPRYLPINTAFADYARLADVARVLEQRYAHNPARARQVIEQEMLQLGATKVGGKWYFRGKPVRVTALILISDNELRQTGDYVSRLLEELGFTVERRYGRPDELSPIWSFSPPEEGRWHFYTGAWISSVVSRDQAGNFDFFYTPRGRSDPYGAAIKPAPEFDALAQRLARREFSSLEERKRLFAQALELALQDSLRVWLVDRVGLNAYRRGLQVTADLAGGIPGSWLWPYTLRWADRVGGTVRFAQPNVLTEPWNPIGGSGWIADITLFRATAVTPTLPDPHTGLHWPQRVERAQVFVKRGLPVSRTLPWVDLQFVDEIRVPGDAWIDWDPKAQVFIPVAARHPDGLTANVKVVVRYDRRLAETARWHDGSPFSLGDMVMKVILTFDRAKAGSPIFDRAAVPSFTNFQRHFRGFRIVSREPLVVEYYTDAYLLDAENIAADAAWFAWPYYATGPAPWHGVAIGTFAEARQRLAFTKAKAAQLKVEHMSYIAGPSLAILKEELRNVRRQAYIPYEPTLRAFVSAQEATQRWAKLRRWVEAKGHFWIGNGPFYLERAYPVERVVHLKRNPDFTDPADKWLRFGAPAVPVVQVSGPARLAPGAPATFDVQVSFEGRPYPVRDIAGVRWLAFDARGRVVAQGDARAVRDGLWRVELDARTTADLRPGPLRLDVIVSSQRVSMPVFATRHVVVRR